MQRGLRLNSSGIPAMINPLNPTWLARNTQLARDYSGAADDSHFPLQMLMETKAINSFFNWTSASGMAMDAKLSTICVHTIFPPKQILHQSWGLRSDVTLPETREEAAVGTGSRKRCGKGGGGFPRPWPQFQWPWAERGLMRLQKIL